MYLFTISSKINPKSTAAEKLPEIGGAFVNCYIQFKDYEAAEKLAKLLIKDEGWIPGKVTDAWRVHKNKVKTKKQRQYYSEAIKYGYSLVFHMWPKDADDADIDDAAQRSRK